VKRVIQFLFGVSVYSGTEPARPRAPHVGRPRLRALACIREAGVVPIFAVRPHRLSLLLVLCRPELIPSMLLHDTLHHVDGFSEGGGRRALQLKEQVVSDIVIPRRVSRGHGNAHECRVDELDALCFPGIKLGMREVGVGRRTDADARV
jgi:hypothetical protein